MTIENKELFNLFKSLFKTGKIDSIYHGSAGMYLEGFDGGITVHLTDNKAYYRKTFYGDNKDLFVYYFSEYKTKDGYFNNKDYEPVVNDYNKRVFTMMKALFEKERFNKITVNYKEFKKAVKGVDAINKGDKTRNIVLSIHNGKFDIASWNELGSANWQLDGEYNGDGAFMISKKHLDGIKSDNATEISYGEVNGKTAMYITGDVDAVIMPLEINPVEFKEVLEYDFEIPKKPVIKQVQEFKVNGVTFDNRQEALTRLTRYNPKDIHTYLVPEYDNEHDKNAIAVYVLVNYTNRSYRLGYIPKNETSIARNYIGKIPELKIIDGDIKGARVIFEKQIETVIEKPTVKTRKLRTPRIKRENGAYTGWTYNRLGTRQIKVCNW